MPLANYSVDATALDLFLPIIERQLRKTGVELSFPTLAVRARILHAGSGRIHSIADVAGDGDRERLFGIGRLRYRSIAPQGKVLSQRM